MFVIYNTCVRPWYLGFHTVGLCVPCICARLICASRLLWRWIGLLRRPSPRFQRESMVCCIESNPILPSWRNNFAREKIMRTWYEALFPSLSDGHRKCIYLCYTDSWVSPPSVSHLRHDCLRKIRWLLRRNLTAT